MKTEVLKFLRNLPKSNNEKFNKAFEFLRAATGVNFNQMRMYNVYGASDQNIKNIIYDLKKLYGITDAEVLSKKETASKTVVIAGKKIESATVENIDLGNVVSEAEQKKTDLHKEFPFLSSKECPAELHIVTGLLVASWKRYNSLHAELQKVTAGKIELSEDEILELTTNTNSEFENNGKLYKELEYYRDNKTVLGEISELKEFRIKKEIEAMTTEELVKYQKNSAPYLSKANKDLADENIPEDKKVIIRER